jgi:hypothetical protein
MFHHGSHTDYAERLRNPSLELSPSLVAPNVTASGIVVPRMLKDTEVHGVSLGLRQCCAEEANTLSQYESRGIS